MGEKEEKIEEEKKEEVKQERDFWDKLMNWNYEPFDEESQKTDIQKYEPHWFVAKYDSFADYGPAGINPSHCPPTWAGALITVAFKILVYVLVINGIVKLVSEVTVIVPAGHIQINLDWI